MIRSGNPALKESRMNLQDNAVEIAAQKDAAKKQLAADQQKSKILAFKEDQMNRQSADAPKSKYLIDFNKEQSCISRGGYRPRHPLFPVPILRSRDYIQSLGQ